MNMKNVLNMQKQIHLYLINQIIRKSMNLICM